jgi:broad specificity phosphatase PhoE
MKIYLVRHGKSDKSLQDQLSHDEFELKRALVEGEEEKARQLGNQLKEQMGSVIGFDLVQSGKNRSKQTVLAIAEGFGLSAEEANAKLREDFGLAYLADKYYWEECEQAINDSTYQTHADFFLNNPPHGHTFSAEYMSQNMKAVLRRAIERNTFLNNNLVIMVSHEPVITLCMSDLTEKSPAELGGSSSELEYALFDVTLNPGKFISQTTLAYRGIVYDVTAKLFPNFN